MLKFEVYKTVSLQLLAYICLILRRVVVESQISTIHTMLQFQRFVLLNPPYFCQ